MDITEIARAYLAHNAAESGADELIRDLLVEIERLRGEYEHGYREALEVAANDIDCGGQPYCTATKLDDGSCIYSCSKDCAHEEAEHIRSLAPPVNRPAEPAGESKA